MSAVAPPGSPPARSGPLVRRVRADDWEALKALRLRALRTDPQAFGGTLAEEEALPASRWSERARQAATSPVSGQWIAEDAAGGLVGSCVLTELEGRVHVFAMWVDPSVRGRGVGGRLLDAALAWGDHALPGREVQLEVNPRQTTAVQLYEARGFHRTGGRRSLGHMEGEWRIEMVRPPDRRPRPPSGETRRS